MNPFRISALGVALVLGPSAVASAQAAPPVAPVPQHVDPGAARGRGNQQLAGIELSAEQKTKLEAITAKYAGESKGVRELMASDPAEAIKKLMAVREKMVPEVRAVLTAEQRDIFDRNLAAMNAAMGARMTSPLI